MGWITYVELRKDSNGNQLVDIEALGKPFCQIRSYSNKGILIIPEKGLETVKMKNGRILIRPQMKKEVK